MDNKPFSNLHKQQFIHLAANRQSGQPAVTLYGMSEPQAGKIKILQTYREIKPAREPLA
jgi:hypothetical protein